MIPFVLLLLTFLSAPLQALNQNGSGQAQDLCLLFSGEERGYIEPCGCAKPQLGGIAKRHALLKSLSEPWLAVSLGDLVGHVRRQDELKAETIAQALKIMDYSIHNLGEMDLDMGLEVLAYLFPPGSVPLLSSNVRLSSPFIEVAPYRVHEVAGGGTVRRRIGFMGILSPALLGPPPAGVELISPADALPPLIRELRDKVDVLVLLAHAPWEESLKLARDFPEFHLVASGHGEDHPTVVKEGNTWVFTPGIKGKHMVLYRHNTAEGSGVVETITLDEHLGDSVPMLNLLDSYQERLKQEGLLARVEKFPLPEDTSYAGSRACSPCHPAVFRHWGGTLHATAYETLLKAGRAFDPECVACHVVGLNYVSGFQSPEAGPDLRDVGCEACHGPGSLHIAQASAVGNQPLTGYGKVSPEVCQGCHDPEHGPPFRFDPYWERIRHPAEVPVRPAVIK